MGKNGAQRRADRRKANERKRADKRAAKADKLAAKQAVKLAKQAAKVEKSRQRNQRKTDRKVETQKSKDARKTANTAERQKVENVAARQKTMGEMWGTVGELGEAAAGVVGDIYGGALVDGLGGLAGDSPFDQFGQLTPQAELAVKGSGSMPLLLAGGIGLAGLAFLALRR